MVYAILKYVPTVSGMIAIGAGAGALFGILQGKIFKKWICIFLKSSLVTSAMGLLFAFHQFHPAYWVSMFAVYVAGMAILAWRRYCLAGIWALLFALSILLVWCLDLYIAVQQLFELLIPTHSMLFLFLESTVLLLFVGFCIVFVKRYCAHSDDRVRFSCDGRAL